MTLGIGVDWPQMLDDAGATTLAEHVVDLLKQLGHKKLFKYEEEVGTRPIGYFLSLPNPTEDREHDGGFLLSPSKWKFGTHLKVPPVDFGVWTTTKGNLREHRDLRWAELVAELPQQTEAQLLQRLERMVHLTVPRRICIGPIDVVRSDSERRRKRRGALIYIDAKGVALAKKLELGLKVAPGAAGGGWIRSHDKGLDAESDVETAFEIVAAALGRIDKVEYEERFPKR